jgi:acyl carrier protein
MERHKVLAAFRSAMVDILPIDDSTVRESASLADDLGADSLDLVEAVLVLESELGLSVPDEALVNARTVADLLDVILGAGPATSRRMDDAPPPPSSYWSSTGYR